MSLELSGDNPSPQIQLKMVPRTIISGFVQDTAGKPVRTEVWAGRLEYRDGHRQVVRAEVIRCYFILSRAHNIQRKIDRRPVQIGLGTSGQVQRELPFQQLMTLPCGVFEGLFCST
jgi:hypothetical protein